jgi:hypothetical protein
MPIFAKTLTEETATLQVKSSDTTDNIALPLVLDLGDSDKSVCTVTNVPMNTSVWTIVMLSQTTE